MKSYAFWSTYAFHSRFILRVINCQLKIINPSVMVVCEQHDRYREYCTNKQTKHNKTPNRFRRHVAVVGSCTSLCIEYIFFTIIITFSPFNLVFENNLLLNLAFLQLEIFANTHKDYLQLLRGKAEFTASLLLDYKTQQC